MNAATIVAVLAVAAVLFFALRYIVKEKRKGTKCIGCPFAGSCEKFHSGQQSCNSETLSIPQPGQKA